MERSRKWLRETQNSDGSWGFYNEGTAEETAYAVLALARGCTTESTYEDLKRYMAGVRYIDSLYPVLGDRESFEYPALWIDKCLYVPTWIVKTVLEAARTACMRPARLRHRHEFYSPRLELVIA